MSLTGKTALVTGSGRNIGRGIALHLAASGCNLVLNGSQDREACEDVAEKVRSVGAKAAIEICDIGDRKAVLAMAASALDKFGTVDILINNAIFRAIKPFLEIEEMLITINEAFL